MKHPASGHHLILLVILLIGSALRFTGIGYGLPSIYHQDEPIIVHHALAMGVQGWNTHFYVIPPFTMGLLFLVYAVVFVLGRVTHAWMDADGFAISFFNDPTLFYISGRLLLGVIFGIAAVYALYRLGKSHRSPQTGLWAALVLALAPMHVQHSHYIYADIPLALATVLMFERLLALVRKPEKSTYVYFGIFLGWAVSIKYTALYFLPALVAAHFLAHGRKAFSLRGAGLLSMAGIASFGAFSVFAPGVILNFREFLGQMLHQSGAEGSVGWIHHGAYSLGEGMGWSTLLLAAAGWAAMFRDRGSRTQAILIGVFAGTYYVVNALFSQHFARYMMPLVPVVALCAGDALARWVKKPLSVWRLLLVGTAISEMLVVSVYGDWLFLQKDTRTTAMEWIQKNIPSGSAIAVDNRFFAPRLRQTQEQFIDKHDEIGEGPKLEIRRKRLYLESHSDISGPRYRVFTLLPEEQKDRPDFLSMKPLLTATPHAVRREGVEYVICNTTDHFGAVSELLERLEPSVTRIAVFNPYRDPSRTTPLDPYSTTAAPHLRRELFSRLKPGPYLEIFKIAQVDSGISE